jgi:hypothetical protein
MASTRIARRWLLCRRQVEDCTYAVGLHLKYAGMQLTISISDREAVVARGCRGLASGWIYPQVSVGNGYPGDRMKESGKGACNSGATSPGSGDTTALLLPPETPEMAMAAPIPSQHVRKWWIQVRVNRAASELPTFKLPFHGKDLGGRLKTLLFGNYKFGGEYVGRLDMDSYIGLDGILLRMGFLQYRAVFPHSNTLGWASA